MMQAPSRSWRGSSPSGGAPACSSAARTCGLHHLVYEIVDNSVDEALAGSLLTGSLITIHQDERVSVADNGRGIPVDAHRTHNVRGPGADHDHPPRRRQVRRRGYKVSGGLHGVGASVVNALSRWCRVEVRKDGKLYVQEYERGVPRGPRARRRGGQRARHHVIFHADDAVFESLDFESPPWPSASGRWPTSTPG